MTLGIQEACCSTPECFAFFSGFGEAPQKRGIKKHEHYSDLLINISEAVGCVCFVAAQMHIVGLVGCRVTATVSLRRCNPLFFLPQPRAAVWSAVNTAKAAAVREV